MKYNICITREDGDYDVLMSIESDTIGEDAAKEYVEHLQFTLANNDEESYNTVVITTEETHVLDSSYPIVEVL